MLKARLRRNLPDPNSRQTSSSPISIFPTRLRQPVARASSAVQKPKNHGSPYRGDPRLPAGMIEPGSRIQFSERCQAKPKCFPAARQGRPSRDSLQVARQQMPQRPIDELVEGFALRADRAGR